jgi:predicted TIM-barrel fold metal-dependent hydrolase
MIIDFHAHLGSWRQYGMDDSIAHLLECMDRSGVDRCCLFHVFHGDHRRANDQVAAAVRSHPDRFIGFAFVTPHYPEEVVPELRRALDGLGLRALKIYPPYVHVPVTDPLWAPLFEEADGRGLVIISHTGHGDPTCDPAMFGPLAGRYPRVQWVLGHAGITEPGRASACALARRRPNIFLEICTSWRNPGSIEQLVEGAGEDRVLFGSDMPLLEPAIHVGRILTAAISDQAKRNLLGGYALRLLRLDPQSPHLAIPIDWTARR